MCPPHIVVDPLQRLSDLDPGSLAIAVGAVASGIGLTLVLRALVRRQHAVRAAELALEGCSAPASTLDASARATVAAAALALVVPGVTAAVVSVLRAEFRECLALSLQDGIPSTSGCEGWHFAAFEQLLYLALGAMAWLPLLPLAAVALGYATAQRRQALRINHAVAAAHALDEAQDAGVRYRRPRYRAARDAFHRWVTHPAPPLSAAMTSWAAVAVACAAFASGVVHAMWRFERGFLGPFASGPIDPLLEQVASILALHAAVAAVAIVVAAGVALATRCNGATMPRSPLAIALPLAAAALCAIVSVPLVNENANPVRPGAVLEPRSWRWAGAHEPEVPRLAGTDTLLDAPLLSIGSVVALNGATVDGPGELESRAARTRELWELFHPDKPFPGLMLIAADRRLAASDVLPYLHSAASAGYGTARLIVEQLVAFDHPPLGVWRHERHLSTVAIDLGCADDSGGDVIDATTRFVAWVGRAADARRAGLRPTVCF